MRSSSCLVAQKSQLSKSGQSRPSECQAVLRRSSLAGWKRILGAALGWWNNWTRRINTWLRRLLYIPAVTYQSELRIFSRIVSLSKKVMLFGTCEPVNQVTRCEEESRRKLKASTSAI